MKLATLLLATGAFAFGSTTFLITVDTSSIVAQSGYVDLAFNGSNLPGAAQVNTSDYDGPALDPTTVSYMNASGFLDQPGGVTITNTSGFTDYNEGVLVGFGNSTAFEATFSGDEITNPFANDGTTTFFVSFYAADDSTALLTSDPSGSVLEVTINMDGSLSTMSNFAGATATPVDASPTPEPGSLMLIGGGILLMRAVRSSRPAPR